MIATILSSQCTDKQVNRVTPKLFHQLKSPKDFACASLEEIEALIRSTGFYRNKAKNIKTCCRVLLESHGGRVPDRLDELVDLPGVGRKTANVVLGAAFERPGIVVDTHVKRVSWRLGFTENSDPVKIEFDLVEIIPPQGLERFFPSDGFLRPGNLHGAQAEVSRLSPRPSLPSSGQECFRPLIAHS